MRVNIGRLLVACVLEAGQMYVKWLQVLLVLAIPFYAAAMVWITTTQGRATSETLNVELEEVIPMLPVSTNSWFVFKKSTVCYLTDDDKVICGENDDPTK